MKKVTKTKSTKKPALVVDFTNEFNINHPRFAFIEAKLEQKVPFTLNDFDYVCNLMRDYVLTGLFKEHNAVINVKGTLIHCDAHDADIEVKKPWYKRLWNWVTRKK